MYKNIQLVLPVDEKFSGKLLLYTPDEISIIIDTGISCYEKAKKEMINMSEMESIKKLNEEHNMKMEKMEKEILNEKECRGYIVKSLEKIYEENTDVFRLKCEKLENEVKALRKQNEENNILFEERLKERFESEKEKLKMAADEQTKTFEKMETILLRDREIYEKCREDYSRSLKIIESRNTYSSLKHKGNEGENIFSELADEAFGEIEGYDLKDTSTVKHSGDFHMYFKDFGILVDLKNYDTIVPAKEVKKIESDFIKHTHLKFAWLISLNSKIQNNDKGVFTYKILDDGSGRCIFYINELMKQPNVIKFIKSIYYFCKMISVFIKDNTLYDEEENEEEINILKTNYKEVIEEVKLLKKDMSEMNANMNTFKNICDRILFKLNNILKREIENIITDKTYHDMIDEWFYSNYEFCECDETLTSREVWIKFKKDNNVDGMDIDKFKEILSMNIHSDNLIVPKNKKGSIEIKNYREKKTNDEDNIVASKKVAKKKKEKTNDFFSLEVQEKILNLYNVEENDIMEIKDSIDLDEEDIYKIVSFLVSSNVITSRKEARGYEKYKDTETYKNKINHTNNVIIIGNTK